MPATDNYYPALDWFEDAGHSDFDARRYETEAQANVLLEWFGFPMYEDLLQEYLEDNDPIWAQDARFSEIFEIVIQNNHLTETSFYWEDWIPKARPEVATLEFYWDETEYCEHDQFKYDFPETPLVWEYTDYDSFISDWEAYEEALDAHLREGFDAQTQNRLKSEVEHVKALCEKNGYDYDDVVYGVISTATYQNYLARTGDGSIYACSFYIFKNEAARQKCFYMNAPKNAGFEVELEEIYPEYGNVLEETKIYRKKDFK